MLRGERNRRLIVDAVLAFVREGVAYPTAEQIAARARVGTRTVFRHFADMEGLYAAVNERIGAEVAPLLAGGFEGSAAARIRELTRRRTTLYERIAPFRRRTSAREPLARVIRAGIRTLDGTLRAQLREALLPVADEIDLDSLEALDAAFSFECWDRLRVAQGLSKNRAADVMQRTATALLAAHLPLPRAAPAHRQEAPGVRSS